MIGLRPATMRDSDRLFAWRNDPVTCACSKSTAAVTRDKHRQWMEFNVGYGYPEHIVMMAESNAETVGVVRFDGEHNDLMAYEVSITMAPQHRGRGLSVGILDQACRFMKDFTINAEIRKENNASRKIFAACGFDEVGRAGDFLQYRREPLP